jgi:hypothetical protein
MADTITQAFQALQQRWDAIFAREQARFAAVNHDLPMTVRDAVAESHDNFQRAVQEMQDDRSWRTLESDPTYQGWEAGETAEAGYQEFLGAHEEYDAGNPTVLDRVDDLQQRMEDLAHSTEPQAQRQQSQGMEY